MGAAEWKALEDNYEVELAAWQLQKDIYTAHTAEFKKKNETGQLGDVSCFFAGANDFLQPLLNMDVIGKANILVVPIHINENKQLHWTVLLLMRDAKKIIYYDSFSTLSIQKKQGAKYADYLKRWLRVQDEDNYTVSIYINKDSPMQQHKDSLDCGAFVCLYSLFELCHDEYLRAMEHMNVMDPDAADLLGAQAINKYGRSFVSEVYFKLYSLQYSPLLTSDASPPSSASSSSPKSAGTVTSSGTAEGSFSLPVGALSSAVVEGVSPLLTSDVLPPSSASDVEILLNSIEQPIFSAESESRDREDLTTPQASCTHPSAESSSRSADVGTLLNSIEQSIFSEADLENFLKSLERQECACAKQGTKFLHINPETQTPAYKDKRILWNLFYFIEPWKTEKAGLEYLKVFAQV
jgi:hypothetical protein